MLPKHDLDKVFYWLRDRINWPDDIVEIGDKINVDFGHLIKSFTNNKHFRTFISQDGIGSNYLEFICYPYGNTKYQGEAIIVCISLCSPISAYGEIFFEMAPSGGSWSTLEPKSVGFVTNESLINIVNEIKGILISNNFELIDQEFASKPLPIEVDNYLKEHTLYHGNQYLHGIFQITEE